MAELGRRADGDDACSSRCPDWGMIPIPEVDDATVAANNYADSSTEKRSIAGRVLAGRGGPIPVKKIGKCDVSKLMPGKLPPARVPAWPRSGQFLQADRKGFPDAPNAAASKAVPRWYSTTINPVACTPVVVKIDASKYNYNPDDRSKQNMEDPERPSMEHVWEKGWLAEFLGTVIDDKAPDLSTVNDAGTGKMTCQDFKSFMVKPASGAGGGAQSLLKDLFGALASDTNLDFMGMTQQLNGDSKGLTWDTEVQLPKQIKSHTNLEVKTPIDIKKALENMEKKLGLLDRIRLGVYMSNVQENKELINKTNKRIHAAIKRLDEELKTQNPNIKPFTEGGGQFFTKLFRKHMDDLLDHKTKGIKGLVKGHADTLLEDIKSKWKVLEGRLEEILKNSDHESDWNDLKAKWNYYKGLPPSTYEISIKWSWD